jgi:redox-sensitive bicupin YhaK (pirin superfamily)
MSRHSAEEPTCSNHDSPSIELLIRGKMRDLGGFSVRRVLPAVEKRSLGPFVFFDQMGPAWMAPEAGINVRPHPHIALATITYLFEGEIFHRDSLGSAQAIRPGDVNWMVAGRGIVHSERTSPEVNQTGQNLFGIQAWLALPTDKEEQDPGFYHISASSLPTVQQQNVEMTIIAGNAFGCTSPVPVASPTLYVDVKMQPGSEFVVQPDHPERGLFVVSGEVLCEKDRFGQGDMIILSEGKTPTIHSKEQSRLMLVGGAPLEGKRYMWWNFVASTPERIEQAKLDWKEGRFPLVPGDEQEFIPLPE